MNNYILDYYQQIKDGTIIVGEWTKLGYEYIVRGLENKSFFYSGKKAKAAILFIENYCHHHEGILAPQLLKLELWQKAFISALFGIIDTDGYRQFREAFLVIARKNGKTLLAAAIAEYMTFLDGEHGAKIYFCAPKLHQANLCFDAFWQSISREPELDAMARKRRTDVYIEKTNSSAQPLAYSAKKSDGLNIHLSVADEVAAWAGDGGLKFYQVLKSSMGARKQPLLLSISTAGYEHDGIFDELFKRSTRVLKGDSKEKRLLPIMYTIDDISKWNDINELQKSNPNLGVSVSVDYLLEEIAIAEGSLSKKAEFLTKYCNIKQNSSQAFLEYADVEKACGEPLQFADFEDCYCVLGIDLSQTTDLTASCAVIQRNGEFYIFCQFFLPEERIEDAIARDGLPYNEYIKQGLLTVSGTNVVDYHDVAQWCIDLVKKYRIYPMVTGYDRYSAQYLITELEQNKFKCDDVFQGHQLYPIIRDFEGLLKDGKIHIGTNSLLKVHMLNAALKMDTELNRGKLVKIKPTDHIDGLAAVIDAFTVRSKWWGQYGRRLENNESI